MKDKIYLGDGVFASFTGVDIVLTTGDGTEGNITNRIYLNAAVFAALVHFEGKLDATFS